MLADDLCRFQLRGRRRGAIDLLIAFVCLLTGCVNSDIPLRLPNRPLQATVNGGNGRQVVVVTPFRDGRGGIVRCGRRLHNNGMETADVICQSDPMAWIAERFVAELRVAGFAVVAEGDGHEPGALRVEGTLLRLFTEPVLGKLLIGIEADLEVELRATSQTLDSKRTFFVKGWKAGAAPSSSPFYEIALNRASQALVEEMVRAVAELMDRYPQLGSRKSLEGAVATLSAEGRL